MFFCVPSSCIKKNANQKQENILPAQRTINIPKVRLRQKICAAEGVIEPNRHKGVPSSPLSSDIKLQGRPAGATFPHMDVVTHITYWLVKLTILKNISQMGLLFPIYGKIKFMFQTTNQLIKVPVLITKSTTSSEVPCVGPSSYLVPGGDQTSLCETSIVYATVASIYIYTPWQFCIGIDWIIMYIYIYMIDQWMMLVLNFQTNQSVWFIKL